MWRLRGGSVHKVDLKLGRGFKEIRGMVNVGFMMEENMWLAFICAFFKSFVKK